MALRLGSLGTAVVFLLVLGIVSSYGKISGAAVIEVTSGDLADDPATADDRKTAREKVQAKVDRAKAGDVVQFPAGSFKDVGELLFSTDGGEEEGEEIVVRGNIEDPSAVVFTGKVMFNVTASNLVIEGITFKDTKVPDRLTRKRQDQDADDSNDDEFVYIAPHGPNEMDASGGTILINTVYLENGTPSSCPDDFDKLVRNIKIRNNVFRNTHFHGVHLNPAWVPAGGRCGSSDIVISGNTFAGIGFNNDYIDKKRNVRGLLNLETAIKAHKPNRATITDNVIDGTTYAGIMLNETFGKTVIRYNEVRNIPAYGIRVKGNENVDSDYEVVVSNNKISNTDNDPYILRRYNRATGTGAGYKAEAQDFKEANQGLTDKQVDEILKPEIWRVSPGANFAFRATGAPRQVSDFADTEYDGAGARVAVAASDIPQTGGPLGASEPCGDGSTLERWDTGAVEANAQWCYSLVRFIDPALEAAIILAGVTAKTIKVENNEIAGNSVGLLICEGSSCSLRAPYNPLSSSIGEAARGPTVISGNNIATDNDISVVNALEGDDKELDLSGNYLGERPLVYGNVKSLRDVNLADEAFDLSPMTGPRPFANDRTPPSLTSAAVNEAGTVITLTYSEGLDGASDVATGAFTVMKSDETGRWLPIDVDRVDVDGRTVTLTLASSPRIEAGDTVTVTYDISSGAADKVRDMAGNEAKAISSRAVTNNVGVTDGGIPMTGDGGGGCALASFGTGGADAAFMLLPLLFAGMAFAFGRRARRGFFFPRCRGRQ